MNHIYRSIWNEHTASFVAVSENAKGGDKKASASASIATGAGFALKALAAALLLAFGSTSYALPAGDTVVAGSATVTSSNGSMTVKQASQNAVLNWQSFNIGAAEAVRFEQPNSSSVTLNRVIGADPSSILGSLSANGKVFLVNPNGILFGKGASVNVAGLVASTLNISDSDFMAGNYKFAGAGGGILNQGSIHADGGYVALLGANVSNEGIINARLGSIALAAGNAITLDVVGDGLLNVAVNEGAVHALVQNGGMIQADGGQVLMTAQAAGNLLQTAVNNTGVIQAQTIENHDGVIKLLGDMQSGTVNVGGTLDASAPTGGDGGFIDTSAATVNVAGDTKVTTAAAQGLTGSWLIDPTDYTIAATGGDITGATLSANLASTSITIQSISGGTSGVGDININDEVSWYGGNKLTLNAQNNINIRSNMSVNGQGTLALEFGQGALAADNTSDIITMGGVVNLFALANFTTKQGSDGAAKSYVVINNLGTESGNKGLKAMNGNKNYVLGANINASATSGWNGGAGFLPIGDSTTPYTGTFNGLGHTISNLTINRPTTDHVGLFGYIGNTAEIRNVGLTNVTITGNSNVGGLAGYNNGGSISNSYVTGTVSGKDYVGGLVGHNSDGTISQTYVTGTVSGDNTVGGLVGYNWDNGSISQSYATGAVGGNYNVGGLVGQNFQSVISQSYASGTVTGTGSVGGLVGVNERGAITQAYATGAVIGNSYVGGLAGFSNGTISNSYWDKNTTGQGDSAGGIGMITAQMQTQANFTSATAANGNVNPEWDFVDTWVQYDTHTYPLLRSFMTELTITAGADSKTYDGLAYSGGNGVMYSATPDGKLLGSVSYGGNAQGAINAGSYTITASGFYSTSQQGYAITYVDGALTVNQANLTLSTSNVIKTYDGDTTAAGTVTVTDGTLFDGDVLIGGTFAFTDKNVGSGNKTVTTTGVTVSDGNSGDNYNVSYADNTTSTIVPKALTVTGETALDKIYDGTTLATLTGGTLAGIISGDTVTLIEAGTFATPNAGNGIAVTAAVSLSGLSAGNYTVTQPTGLTANITAPVSVVDSDPRNQGAIASAVSLTSVMPLQGNMAGAQSPSRQDGGESSADSSSSATNDASSSLQHSITSIPGGLAGLNLSVTGNGIKLPSGVGLSGARDDRN